jgi:hypothetical protein
VVDFGGELVQVARPGRVLEAGHPRGVGVSGRVEPGGLGDPVVHDVGQAACVGERPRRDSVGEYLARVVPGQLGAAQQGGQGAGAVLHGEFRPLGLRE